MLDHISIAKPTNKQMTEEMEMLRLKNKTLEETNMKLLGMIERLRERLGAAETPNRTMYQ